MIPTEQATHYKHYLSVFLLNLMHLLYDQGIINIVHVSESQTEESTVLHITERLYVTTLLPRYITQHDFGYNTFFSWTPNYFLKISVGLSRHKKFVCYDRI